MSGLLDKLNLSPQERRWVVGALLIVFVVLNAMLVWPHRKDLAQVREELRKSRETLAAYQKEVDQLPLHKARFAKLEGISVPVPTSEQAIQLVRTISSQASSSGVRINDTRPSQGRSAGNKVSEFFDEQIVALRFDAGTKELVDFLAQLGTGNSVIRVRELTLAPDPSQTRLVGGLTLVASYQKAHGAKSKSPASPKP